MWHTAAACPAALAAAVAAGDSTSRAAPPSRNRRRISAAVSNSPRAYARARSIAARGRPSVGRSASNSHKTRAAQSAAHPATMRRSDSLRVCGDTTIPRPSQPRLSPYPVGQGPVNIGCCSYELILGPLAFGQLRLWAGKQPESVVSAILARPSLRRLDAYTALARDVPRHRPAPRYPGDCLPEPLLQHRLPGHEAEPNPVVEHCEPAARQHHRAAVNSTYAGTLRHGPVLEARVGGDLGPSLARVRPPYSPPMTAAASATARM